MHGGALLSLMSASRESARRARLHPLAAPRHALGARLTETLIALITQRSEGRADALGSPLSPSLSSSLSSSLSPSLSLSLSLSGLISDVERAWGERAERGALDLSASLRYALCLGEAAAARGDRFGVSEAVAAARASVDTLTRLLDETPWRSAATPPVEWQRLLELLEL